MAKLIGSMMETGNFGEDLFCKVLADAFPDDYIIYRNRQVFGREFDIAMLIPDIGIAVFEVKGWREATVLRIENGDTIVINTDTGEERSMPQKQVRGYRYAIERRLQQELGMKPIVFGMVVFPQITKACYTDKNLHVVTEPQFTVLREDIANTSALQTKLAEAVNEVRMWHRVRFDADLMYHTRCLFEGDIAHYSGKAVGAGELKRDRQAAYSKFFFWPDLEAIPEVTLQELGECYNNGTKIYAVVANNDQLRQIVYAIDKVLDKKCLFRTKGRLDVRYEADQKHYPPVETVAGQFTAFNCSISMLSHGVTCESFEIEDGVEGAHHDDLDSISKASGFNYNQYEVEHVPGDRNIVIRAGAGTGKTFTMISRIGYIAHKCTGSILDLLECVTMITFTNEAADQMRNKLKEYFRNYYLITGNKLWLQLVSKIDKMQISTIHSYAKKLIDTLGVEYGYGCDVSITSSEFARYTLVSKLVNQYVTEKLELDSRFVDKLGLPMYELVSNIVSFISKLQNKSVDVSLLVESNFGQISSDAESPALHELLCYVIPQVEKNYQAELLDENSVHLSSIMALLNLLILDPDGQKRIREMKRSTPGYLFVDEFQDTDNIQIQILVTLCKLLDAKMFVVGDIKQCIYRFRGATEEAFAQLPIQAIPAQWKKCVLRRNYRTDAQLLNIFDQSFRRWGSDECKLLSYQPKEDRLLGTKQLNSSQPVQKFFTPLHIASDSNRMDSLFNEIRRLQSWIEGDIRSGKQLSADDKTIAILVRDNWQAEAIKAEGERRDIPIYTNTGGDLYQTDAAIDMLTLANALLHYDDPEYLFSLLSSNFFNIKVPYTDLYQKRSDSKWNPETAHKDMSNYLTKHIDSGLYPMPDGLKTWGSIVLALRTTPVLQILHRIYERLKPDANYAKGNQWEQKYYRMNVDLLFERVIASSNTDHLTINSFAKSLRICVMSGVSVNSRIPATEEKAAIQCITVHKAKGLEYGHVILPYANFGIDKLKKAKLGVSVQNQGENVCIGYSIDQSDLNKPYRNQYYNEQSEKEERSREETRILYVAMTRAIRSFSWIIQDDAKGLMWQNLICAEEG